MKNKHYKAIKIDAQKRTIYEVFIDDYKDIQKEIGCKCFCTGQTLREYDILYVDDEGLINGTRHGFYYNGRLFAGNGLICGGNSRGDSDDVKMTELNVAMNVEFVPYGMELNPVAMEESANITVSSFNSFDDFLKYIKNNS